MRSFTTASATPASPFTRVGSQVQSLPRPPLNISIYRAFSGDQSWQGYLQYAERYANKRHLTHLSRTYPVQQPQRIIRAMVP